MAWLRRFRAFVADGPEANVGGDDVVDFLSHLAQSERVSASTQNQAFSALLFLFRHVLGEELDVARTVRAPERRRLPVVLNSAEVQQVLTRLPRRFALMARLIYGAGLRLQECLELRVKDLLLDDGILIIRSGKGDKDRRTVLPVSLRGPLSRQLRAARRLHDADRQGNVPGVALPHALARKYPSAGQE